MLMQKKSLASYYDNRTLWPQVTALRCKPQLQFVIGHGGGGALIDAFLHGLTLVPEKGFIDGMLLVVWS